MSKFAFFNPTNGSNVEGKNGQLTGNPQVQMSARRPEGAPKKIIGFKSEEENVTQVVDKQTERKVEAAGLEPATR